MKIVDDILNIMWNMATITNWLAVVMFIAMFLFTVLLLVAIYIIYLYY